MPKQLYLYKDEKNEKQNLDFKRTKIWAKGYNYREFSIKRMFHIKKPYNLITEKQDKISFSNLSFILTN